jgi:septal ring factor EnvC (AmiA/AmiB activator)
MSDRQMSEDEFRRTVLDGLRQVAGLLKDLLTYSQAAATRAATEMAAAKAAAERDREPEEPDPPTLVC